MTNPLFASQTLGGSSSSTNVLTVGLGMSLQDLRDELREILGVDIDDYSNVKVDRWLNLAWWELQDKIKLREKEGEASFSTVISQRDYAINSTISSDFENTEHVAILISGTYVPLKYTYYDNFMDKRSDDSTARNTPAEYSRLGGDLFLWPTPDAIYTILVKYRRTLLDLSQTNGPPIPQAWHEFILLGGVMRGFRAMGEYNRSAAIRLERDSLMVTALETETKEQRDYSMAGIKLIRQRYP